MQQTIGHSNPAPGVEQRWYEKREMLDRDIMLVPDVLSFEMCQDIIRVAEASGRWAMSRVVNPAEYGYARTSHGIFLARGTDLSFAKAEDTLFEVAVTCAMTFKNWACPRLVYTHDTGYELLRYQKGQYFKAHVDNAPAHPIFNQRQLSLVFFLNDDFKGGELYFKRQNVRIRPVAGSVAMFPSNFVYEHEAEPVLEGTKYSIVSWICHRPALLNCQDSAVQRGREVIDGIAAMQQDAQAAIRAGQV